MATLDDITLVQIGLNTTGVARADFGTSLIVGPHLGFTNRVQAYTKYDDVVSAGLPADITAAAQAAFAQTPHPKFVKIGRRNVGTAIIKINAVNLTTYTITITGTSPEVYSFTSDATAIAAEIATGLALAITSDSNETLTATVVNTTDIQLAWISQANLQTVKLGSNLSWGTITAVDTVAVDMNAIRQEDNSWYGLISSDRTKQVQLDFAAWTETQDKIFGCASSEAAILTPGTTTDVISVLKNTRYYRTYIGYSALATTQYPDSAWMNALFPLQPGSETWALKKLSGVTPDNLTNTDRNTIINKGGNTFEFYQFQIALTGPGKTAAGEWIDIIRGRDWLKDLIQTNMVQMVINRAKVPYTDGGIQLCVNNLRKSLEQGQRVGFIAPDEVDSNGKTVPGFVITAPLSQSIDPLVKASRVLTLEFTARIAGAIHVININGNVGYSLT
jgi:hypothetical protein